MTATTPGPVNIPDAPKRFFRTTVIVKFPDREADPAKYETYNLDRMKLIDTEQFQENLTELVEAYEDELEIEVNTEIVDAAPDVKV